MSVVLLVLGILVAGAGVVTIGFGIPINEFSLGNTLIIAGTAATAGGLVLVGLAAAVWQLTRIAEALRARPMPRSFRPAEAFEPVPPGARPGRVPVAPPLGPEGPSREPRPAVGSTLDVSATAIERLRSSIARPDRKPEVVAEADEVPLSPGAPSLQTAAQEPAPAVGTGSAAVETREARLDFLVRARPARPAQTESFDALWPKRASREAESQPKIEEAAGSATAATAVQGEDRRPVGEAPTPVAAEEPRPVEILKSGVVDGMAYTLYADGSIEAQLPQGTVRFGSIAELRAHIENNS